MTPTKTPAIWDTLNRSRSTCLSENGKKGQRGGPLPQVPKLSMNLVIQPEWDRECVCENRFLEIRVNLI